MYYFYVLHSGRDDSHYYGSTTNLKNRLQEHLDGNVTSTRYRRPVRLIYYEAYETMELARLREKQVKASGSIRVALHKRIG